MSNAEARRIVREWLEEHDYAVYTGAQSVGKRTMPDLIAVSRDEADDKIALVRVMVGKRPRANGKLYHDPRRVGIKSNALAVVHPEDGWITFSDCQPLPPRLAMTPEARPPYAMGGV